jgi:starch-binding outer membrane protein SusE/F
MKRYLNILIFFFAMVIFFTGCKKDDKEPVLDTNLTISPEWIIKPAPDSYYLLEKDSSDVVIADFEWTKVVFPLSDIPDPLYTLQVLFPSEVEGELLWENPGDIFTTSELNTTLKQGELNAAILSVIGEEFMDGVIMDAGFRIKANVNANDVSSVIDAFTDVSPFTVTPYKLTVPKLYVPGEYQGWDLATAPNIWSPESDGKYSGFVYFPEGVSYEFKFTNAPDWDHTSFGAGVDEGTLVTEPDASNLSVPEFGGYWLTCDTIALTWTFEPQSWGVIGSGILDGTWGDDVDLEYDETTKTLRITIDVTESQDGGDLRFKFRADDGWTTNLGLMDPPEDNELSYGGPDIPMPDGAGNYTFVLDMGTAVPTYQLIKN